MKLSSVRVFRRNSSSAIVLKYYYRYSTYLTVDFVEEESLVYPKKKNKMEKTNWRKCESK